MMRLMTTPALFVVFISAATAWSIQPCAQVAENSEFRAVDELMSAVAPTLGAIDRIELYFKDKLADFGDGWARAHEARVKQVLDATTQAIQSSIVLTEKEKATLLEFATKTFKDQQEKLISDGKKLSGFDIRRKLAALQSHPNLSRQWVAEQIQNLSDKKLLDAAERYQAEKGGPIVFPDESNTVGADTIRKLAARTDLDAVIRSDVGLRSQWLNDERLQKNAFESDRAYRTILAQGPSLKFLLSEDSGVHERYTIGEHQGRVIDIYEAQKKFYHLDKVKLPAGVDPRDNERFFKTMLSLHDIGKSIAVHAGDKDLQHEYIVPLMTRYMKADHFTPEQIKLAVALVDHDAIGDYLKGSIQLDEATTILKQRALLAGMNERDFFKLQMLFYTSDAASYPGLTHMVFGVPREKINAAFYINPNQKLSVVEAPFKNLAAKFGGDPTL